MDSPVLENGARAAATARSRSTGAYWDLIDGFLTRSICTASHTEAAEVSSLRSGDLAGSMGSCRLWGTAADKGATKFAASINANAAGQTVSPRRRGQPESARDVAWALRDAGAVRALRNVPGNEDALRLRKAWDGGACGAP
ncbi:hypothetical protein DBA20_21405 [Pandoraea capi]|nr:hypothetical protein [Pandoraea sp. LA3]MDN4585535.1 hypothetical protein [Pandoraea capi]